MLEYYHNKINHQNSPEEMWKNPQKSEIKAEIKVIKVYNTKNYFL
jgi:hypothetical protein